MKKSTWQAIGLLSLLVATNSYAVDHSMHTGNSGSSSGMACVKAQLSKFEPEHLATVSPESEFSFLAFNVQKPEQIEVTIKSQVVALTIEPKGDFFRIVGQLPHELRDTTARINIKVNAKNEKCNVETGWLVTITP
ncbi:MAG: hypothetical protein RLZZ66_296 [Pseudomonadota bacterium]|jgi:hypothetical protein